MIQLRKVEGISLEDILHTLEVNKIKPKFILENPENKDAAILIDGHKYDEKILRSILPKAYHELSLGAMRGKSGRPTTVSLFYLARFRYDYGPDKAKIIKRKTKVAIVTNFFDMADYMDWSYRAHNSYGYKIELEELEK